MLNKLVHKLSNLSDSQLLEVDRFIDSLSSNTNESFEKFWETWRKTTGAKNQSKKKTLQAFEKAIKRTTLETILSAIENQDRFMKEQRELGEFVAPWKHATTWLNQECWENEMDFLDWNDKSQVTEAISKNPKLGEKLKLKNNRLYNELRLSNLI